MSFMPDGDLSYGLMYNTVFSPFDRETIAFTGEDAVGGTAYDAAIVAVQISGQMNWGLLTYLGPYLQSHGLTTIPAVELGFSVVSVEYTPTSVPEPSTLTLIGLAAFGLLRVRRHSTSLDRTL